MVTSSSKFLWNYLSNLSDVSQILKIQSLSPKYKQSALYSVIKTKKYLFTPSSFTLDVCGQVISVGHLYSRKLFTSNNNKMTGSKLYIALQQASLPGVREGRNNKNGGTHLVINVASWPPHFGPHDSTAESLSNLGNSKK